MQDIELGPPDEKNIGFRTPTQERRYIENEKLKEEWRICGSGTSRHLVKYLVQIGISFSVLGFSFAKLSSTSEDKEIYLSLVSFILGVIFPHPTISKGD